jgi:hypothetical protein
LHDCIVELADLCEGGLDLAALAAAAAASIASSSSGGGGGSSISSSSSRRQAGALARAARALMPVARTNDSLTFRTKLGFQ